MFARWKKFVFDVAREILAAWLSFRRPGVPLSAKLTALAGLFYIILPIDIIPDVMPVVGWLDDMAMLPLFSYMAGKLIPADIMNGLRNDAERILFRFGPKALFWASIVVLLWICLAVAGTLLLWQNWREAPPQTPETPKTVEADDPLRHLPMPGEVRRL